MRRLRMVSAILETGIRASRWSFRAFPPPARGGV